MSLSARSKQPDNHIQTIKVARQRTIVKVTGFAINTRGEVELVVQVTKIFENLQQMLALWGSIST